MKITLGDKVKDIVTGFTGIVVAHSQYLNGCTRFGVQSDKLKDGIPTEAQWFDEPQLRVVKASAVECGPRDTGGPVPFKPQQRANPR